MPEPEQILTPQPDHFRVRVYDNCRDVAYFELPDYPRDDPQGCVGGQTIAIHDLLGDDYVGPKLNLDFDRDGRPVGIEVLYPFIDEA